MTCNHGDSLIHLGSYGLLTTGYFGLRDHFHWSTSRKALQSNLVAFHGKKTRTSMNQHYMGAMAFHYWRTSRKMNIKRAMSIRTMVWVNVFHITVTMKNGGVRTFGIGLMVSGLLLESIPAANIQNRLQHGNPNMHIWMLRSLDKNQTFEDVLWQWRAYDNNNNNNNNNTPTSLLNRQKQMVDRFRVNHNNFYLQLPSRWKTC